MQAALSSAFSMGPLLQSLMEQVQPQQLRSKSVRQTKLGELLAIKDSPSSKHSKLESWKQLVNAPLPGRHPDVYEQDVLRSCWTINGTTFNSTTTHIDSKQTIQEIDNHLLDMLSAMHCKLAESTKDLNLLRYLLQDLMNQLIFVLDPNFPTLYNEQLLQKGMMLLHNGEHDAVKTHHFSLQTKGTALFLTAVQYWKVVNAKQPTTQIGFDGQRMELMINLEHATRENLLDCLIEATCSMMFHGVRKTVMEIAF